MHYDVRPSGMKPGDLQPLVHSHVGQLFTDVLHKAHGQLCAVDTAPFAPAYAVAKGRQCRKGAARAPPLVRQVRLAQTLQLLLKELVRRVDHRSGIRSAVDGHAAVEPHRAHLAGEPEVNVQITARDHLGGTSADVDHAAEAILSSPEIAQCRLFLTGGNLQIHVSHPLQQRSQLQPVDRVTGRGGGEEPHLPGAHSPGLLSHDAHGLSGLFHALR